MLTREAQIVLSKLLELRDSSGSVTIIEAQLQQQIGEDAVNWNLHDIIWELIRAGHIPEPPISHFSSWGDEGFRFDGPVN